MKTVSIDNEDHARLKMIRDEWDKDMRHCGITMALKDAVRYVLNAYEDNDDIIKPGMFDPDREV